MNEVRNGITMTQIQSCWSQRRSNPSTKIYTEDERTSADTDYSRIIHSASFRRLQGKTQILNIGDSDFYRTRLTHSLEVAQIAAGIVRKISQNQPELKPVLPEYTQIQAIALTHDLGHPPFGHGGEVALNYCMKGEGGFEGNGQTLRILSKLENFSTKDGADLTRRTLLGVLKYPAAFSKVVNNDIQPTMVKETESIRIIDRHKSKPPKCYMDSEVDVVDWILEPLTAKDKETFVEVRSKNGKHGKTVHKSLDCSIMDVADDISYGVHDLEDAIELNLLTLDEFRSDVDEAACLNFLNMLQEKYPDEFGEDVYKEFSAKLFGDSKSRKRQISRLVGYFMSQINVLKKGIFEEPLLNYNLSINPDADTFLDELKSCVLKRVIQSPNVQQLEFKGQKMVVNVFEAIASEPMMFLPKEVQEVYVDSGESKRVICDYIAGMSDSFLLKVYERLFSPRTGSIFDKL